MRTDRLKLEIKTQIFSKRDDRLLWQTDSAKGSFFSWCPSSIKTDVLLKCVFNHAKVAGTGVIAKFKGLQYTETKLDTLVTLIYIKLEILCFAAFLKPRYMRNIQ